VHVTTRAEVKEQVLKYIPVMARPLVMYGKNPVVWSQVYADRVVRFFFLFPEKDHYNTYYIGTLSIIRRKLMLAMGFLE
jgi:hypothetical protein